MTYPQDPFENAPENGQYFDASQQPVMPESYLVWTILATVLCCVPFGAVGIYFSTRVQRYWQMGQYADAADASKKAKMWAIIAAVTGIVVVVAYAVFAFVFGDPAQVGY